MTITAAAPHEGWQRKSSRFFFGRLLHLVAIFYWSSVNFVCSVQPDAAVTQWRLGHAQKKSLMKISKGIGYYMFLGNLELIDRFLFLVFFLHGVLVIRIEKLVVRETGDVNVPHRFIQSLPEFLEILLVCCRNE